MKEIKLLNSTMEMMLRRLTKETESFTYNNKVFSSKHKWKKKELAQNMDKKFL